MLTRALVVTLLVAFLSMHCFAQCTTPDRCIAPEVCCADKINGELCYRPGISHDCVASTTGGFLLCPPGWLGCGNQCYLASLHQCVNNLLVPIVNPPPPPPPPPSCPSTFICQPGELCCQDKFKGSQCYTPATFDCVPSSAGGLLLCPQNYLVCNDKLHGEQCYLPGISHDCVASTTGGFLLCPPGWLSCGDVCYLSSQHQCVNNLLVPITPAVPPTAPATTCPANFPCLTGESCCLDRTKGPQCFRPGISHDCVASSAGGFLLCPPGWLGCGNQCYLASLHSCVNNVLIPVSTPTTCPANFQCLAGESCCQDRTKGPQCYRPGISHDCVVSSAGGFLLCPPGWLGCGDACYLATQHQCINNVVVPI